MTDRTLARIAALLRKAEGTDNDHEAQAFMQAAQRIATLESIDLAVARAHNTTEERRDIPEQRTITIGESGKRGLGTYVQLFVVISRANGVTCDVARNSTFVYAYGFGRDLDVCEALYSSLVVQMVSACARFLRSGEHKQDVQVRWDQTTRRRVSRPVHGTTARINFQTAFSEAVGERLQRATDEANAEAVRDRSTVGSADRTAAAERTTGVAIALRAKELEVKDFYSSTSQARGAWRGTTAGHSESSQRAGRRAGQRARLGEPTAVGGARKAVGAG